MELKHLNKDEFEQAVNAGGEVLSKSVGLVSPADVDKEISKLK